MVKTEKCDDANCPLHGSLKTRGRSFKGHVVSAKAQKSAVVEWSRVKKIKKFERYEKKRTRIQVHNPSCINAKEGDYVEIMECRPLSKTKKFVIISLTENKYEKESVKEDKKEAKVKKPAKKAEKKSIESKKDKDEEN